MLDAMIAALPQTALRGPEQVQQPAQGSAPDFAATLAAALAARTGGEAATPTVGPGGQPPAIGAATVTARAISPNGRNAPTATGPGCATALPTRQPAAPPPVAADIAAAADAVPPPATDLPAPLVGLGPAARSPGPDSPAPDLPEGHVAEADAVPAAMPSPGTAMPGGGMPPEPAAIGQDAPPAPVAVVVPPMQAAARTAPASPPEETLAASAAPLPDASRGRPGVSVAHGQHPVSAPVAASRRTPGQTAEAAPAATDAPTTAAEAATLPQPLVARPERSAPDGPPAPVAAMPALPPSEAVGPAREPSPAPSEAQARGTAQPQPSPSFVPSPSVVLPDAPADRAAPTVATEAPRPAAPPPAQPHELPAFGFASDPARQGFDLRLDTPGLGAVEVEVRQTDGAAEVVVRSDRADTLAVLARDGAELDRALRDAGIGPDGRSMSFLLAQGDGQPGQRQRGPGARLSVPEPMPVPGGTAPRGAPLSLLDIHV